MATPWARQSAIVASMVEGSPACMPQAMLAELMLGRMAASSPQPSPRSQLKSISAIRAQGFPAEPLCQRQPDSGHARGALASAAVVVAEACGREAQGFARPELRQPRQV